MKKSELRKYAKLIARIGANVQKDQDVVIVASVDDSKFANMVSEECYKAKARKVYIDFFCDETQRIMYKYTKTEVLQEIPSYILERYKYRAKTLPAMIYLESSDPDAMASVDQSKVMAVRKAQGPIIRPIRKEMENKYQWTIVALPGKAWAKKLFPNETTNKAVELLWDAIFKCARVYGDPVKNWDEHNSILLEKCNKLNNMNIDTLYYKNSLGTDFSVKLLKGLIFLGGGETTINGTYYNPNMPTEECFTTPDKLSAQGVVYASKPLSVNGKVVKDFGFRFKDGVICEVLAKDEETKNVLKDIISLDEGASRLGEVALVPFDSPVNQTNLLFYNTLFDENACCHLAIGMGFEDCIDGYKNMSKEEIEKYGINDSIIHIDFMIGTSDLDIKARLTNGKEVQIFKDGTWAI